MRWLILGMVVTVVLGGAYACGDDDSGPNCPADAFCGTRECGPDPVCLTSCGDCTTGTCTAAGTCTCMPNCAGRVCGSDGCGGTCAPGCAATERCNAAGACEAAGNLPCDGCAGDPCTTNPECMSGFLCQRINSTYAWCSNCDLWSRNCVSSCTADVNCGTDGICAFGGICFHRCGSNADCPSGYRCLGDACIPATLPGINEECMTSANGWCNPDTTDTCLYSGTDPVTDPGLNYCTRLCSTDTDCTDTFVAGCCRMLSDYNYYCMRREQCT